MSGVDRSTELLDKLRTMEQSLREEGYNTHEAIVREAIYEISELRGRVDGLGHVVATLKTNIAEMEGGEDRLLEAAAKVAESESRKYLPGGPFDVKGLLRRVADNIRAVDTTELYS